MLAQPVEHTDCSGNSLVLAKAIETRIQDFRTSVRHEPLQLFLDGAKLMCFLCQRKLFGNNYAAVPYFVRYSTTIRVNIVVRCCLLSYFLFCEFTGA